MAGRFQKGQSGNPKGKPPGLTLAGKLRKAVDKEFDSILDTLLKLAKAGDTQALNIILTRTIPTIKATFDPVTIDTEGETLTEQAESVLSQAIAGKISVDHAQAVISGLANIGKLKEIDDLTKRIEALEAKNG